MTKPSSPSSPPRSLMEDGSLVFSPNAGPPTVEPVGLTFHVNRIKQMFLIG